MSLVKGSVAILAMFVKMVQCAIDLLENFVNCEAQHDDGYCSGDDTISYKYHFQILLPSGLIVHVFSQNSLIYSFQKLCLIQSQSLLK